MIILDDRFALHPLIIGLSDRAFRAFIEALEFMAQFETELIQRRFVPAGSARELLESGLLAQEDGAYRATDTARTLAHIGPRGADVARIAQGFGSKALDLAPKPESSKALALEGELVASFARFWDAFGLKTGRKKAWEAWRKATKTTDPEAIIDAARRYRDWLAGHPSPPSQKYAQGWLNDRRWEDELAAYPQNGKVDHAAGTLADALELARQGR